MKYVSKATALGLNSELALGATGEEQDWEFELADGDRLLEFIEFFQKSDRDDERDFALLSLMLASFDELVSARLNKINKEYEEIFTDHSNCVQEIYLKKELDIWSDLKRVLLSNISLYLQLVRYWSCLCEYSFGGSNAITPLFHQVLLAELSKG